MNVFAIFLILSCGLSAWAAPAKPNLVVVLVIDQFRADTLTRFEKQFGPDGFKFLMNKGAYYPLGQYDVLQSVTSIGHSTILTGSYPYQSGIIQNTWYDSEKKDSVYCTEDRAEQIVPTPHPDKPHLGTSPRNLAGTTVGDELKNAGYASRVIAISQKDRSAILLGGHRADLAIWMDDRESNWVSSHYYRPDGKLPDWVSKLNQNQAALRKTLPVLSASGPGGGMSLPNQPGQKHSDADLNEHYAKVALTFAAAKSALQEYKLGTGKAPDLLAISLSSHDYLAHEMGHNSREIEELTLAEDRAVTDFFKFIARSVPGGLAKTLIVFTADHGGPPAPPLMKSVGIEAGYLTEKEMVAKIESGLIEKFGAPGKNPWIAFGLYFNYWINAETLASRGIARVDIENEIKALLIKMPGIAHAFTHSDHASRILPPGIFERQINKSYHSARGPDVVAIPKPFYMSSSDFTVHQTGYNYDRTVPIIFAGPGIKPGRYPEKAEVVDIAPTLAFLLGTLPPALSEGRVLSEAITK